MKKKGANTTENVLFPLAEIYKKLTTDQKFHKIQDLLHVWFPSNRALIRIILRWLAETGPAFPERAGAPGRSSRSKSPQITMLDPFMGSGIILDEALAAGMSATGIDINPVAWFFAKTMLEPIDEKKLRQAVKRLETHHTRQGRQLRDELEDYYQTDCPCTEEHRKQASIIRMFWIQTAICSNAACQKRIPLFDDFIIYSRKVNIPFYANVQCPHCQRSFDWDQQRATLVARSEFMANSPNDAAGVGRSNKRWAYGIDSVNCGWCNQPFEPTLSAQPLRRKKVSLTVLFCPHCQCVWQHRGTLTQSVRCPACRSSYYPRQGNMPQADWYLCPYCGTNDKISDSFLALKAKERLPAFPYAIEGYCPACHRSKKKSHNCALDKSHGKFFKKISPNDLSQYIAICQTWSKEQAKADFPLSKIIEGRWTQPLLKNNYFYWFQLFNGRQLLSLSTLFDAIRQEKDEPCRNYLLLAFLFTLESNNVLAAFDRKRHRIRGVFEGKQFSLPYATTEANIMGNMPNDNSFISYTEQIRSYLKLITPSTPSERLQRKSPARKKNSVWCSSITSLASQDYLSPADLLFTEIPTAVDSRFFEWSDFYYVWLRIALKDDYAFFSPEHVHRVENLNHLSKRSVKPDFYFNQLRNCLSQCVTQLQPQAMIILLLPFQEEKFWTPFFETLFRAGLAIEFIYPVPAPELALPSNIIEGQLVIGCQKLVDIQGNEKSNWADLFDRVFYAIEQEVRFLNRSGYGNLNLPLSAQRFILLGKSLGPIGAAFEWIQNEAFPHSFRTVYQNVNKLINWALHPEHNLPASLKHVDSVSYIYFACLCNLAEIGATELRQLCQSICEPEVLLRTGLVTFIRQRTGKSYKILEPLERYEHLRAKYLDVWQHAGVQADLFVPGRLEKMPEREVLIDVLHLMLGLIDSREDIHLFLKQSENILDQLKAACVYLIEKKVAFTESVETLLQQLEAEVSPTERI